MQFRPDGGVRVDGALSLELYQTAAVRCGSALRQCEVLSCIG